MCYVQLTPAPLHKKNMESKTLSSFLLLRRRRESLDQWLSQIVHAVSLSMIEFPLSCIIVIAFIPLLCNYKTLKKRGSSFVFILKKKKKKGKKKENIKSACVCHPIISVTIWNTGRGSPKENEQKRENERLTKHKIFLTCHTKTLLHVPIYIEKERENNRWHHQLNAHRAKGTLGLFVSKHTSHSYVRVGRLFLASYQPVEFDLVQQTFFVLKKTDRDG